MGLIDLRCCSLSLALSLSFHLSLPPPLSLSRALSLAHSLALSDTGTRFQAMDIAVADALIGKTLASQLAKFATSMFMATIKTSADALQVCVIQHTIAAHRDDVIACRAHS